MTTSNKDKIAKVIERVQKLLNLSAENGATEAEAMSAAEKAHSILAEYNLSLSDVTTKKSGKAEFVTDDTTETADSLPWRRGIAAAVAELYFCKYFFITIRKQGPKTSWKADKHCFVGASHNVAVAKQMFSYIHETIHRLANENALQQPKAEQWPYRTSFKNAASVRIQSRIAKRIANAMHGKVQSESGTNLPALLDLYTTTREQLDEYLKATVGKLKESKDRSQITHRKGAADGLAAGDKIGLDTQVETKPKRKSLAKMKADLVNDIVATL
jgi:ElaB/YqjD/DUF883 family membrane-anchored ribosome-binding protein